MNNIIVADFSDPEKQERAKLQVVFNQGRKMAIEQLLNYDKGLDEQLRKDAEDQSNAQLGGRDGE